MTLLVKNKSFFFVRCSSFGPEKKIIFLLVSVYQLNNHPYKKYILFLIFYTFLKSLHLKFSFSFIHLFATFFLPELYFAFSHSILLSYFLSLESMIYLKTELGHYLFITIKYTFLTRQCTPPVKRECVNS